MKSKLIILFVIICSFLSAQESYFTIDQGIRKISMIEVSHSGNDVIIQFQGTDKKSYFICNSEVYGPYNTYYTGVASADKLHFGLNSHKGDFVVIDGKIYNGFQKVSRPALSPQGSQFAFSYMQDDQYFININERIQGPYDYAFEPAFSPVSGKPVLRYVLDEQVYLSIGTDTFGPYEVEEQWGRKNMAVSMGEVYFSKDESFYAYSCIQKGEWNLILNGSVIKTFPLDRYMGSYSFPHFVFFDDDSYAYRYPSEYLKESLVYISDEYGPYARVSAAQKNGNSIIFSGKINNSEEQVILNGETIAQEYIIIDPVLHKNKVLSYSYYKKIDNRNRAYFKYGDESLGPFNKIEKMVFDAEGNNYAVIYTNNNRWYVNVNGDDRGEYRLLPDMHVNSQNELTVTYIQNGEVFITSFEW